MACCLLHGNSAFVFRRLLVERSRHVLKPNISQYSIIRYRAKTLKQVIPVNIQRSEVCFHNTRGFSRRPERLPFEKEYNVSKNILIFSYRNQRFYRLLTIFGLVQFLFWGYLSRFSYTTLRDVDPPSGEDGERSSWWRIVNLGKNKYKNGIALLCLSIGYIVFFITLVYPLRSVQFLWLLKGGKSVGITTYAPFGRKYSVVAPLENINCVQSRTQAQSQVPLKVKGKWFFYLLDQKGTYHNPELFDYAIGLKRKLN